MTPFNAIPLSDTLSVTGQISPDDLQAIAAAGFKSLVCNRPDGESPGQFSSKDIATAAHAAGLKLAYLPVVSGSVRAQDGRDFGDLLTQLPSPVLAYCRSGTRSALLWALSQVGSTPWPDLVHRAAQAGFNLTSLVPPVPPSKS